MLKLPVFGKLVMHCALLELPDPLKTTAVHPAIALPLLVNPTIPVGSDPFTVAVNVTAVVFLTGFAELASVTPGGGGGATPGVHASTSVRNEYLPFAAALMFTRILLVATLANDTVRFTRLLPVTEACVMHAEPFPVCTSKAVSPRRVKVIVSLGSTGDKL